MKSLAILVAVAAIAIAPSAFAQDNAGSMTKTTTTVKHAHHAKHHARHHRKSPAKTSTSTTTTTSTKAK